MRSVRPRTCARLRVAGGHLERGAELDPDRAPEPALLGVSQPDRDDADRHAGLEREPRRAGLQRAERRLGVAPTLGEERDGPPRGEPPRGRAERLEVLAHPRSGRPARAPPGAPRALAPGRRAPAAGRWAPWPGRSADARRPRSAGPGPSARWGGCPPAPAGPPGSGRAGALDPVEERSAKQHPTDDTIRGRPGGPGFGGLPSRRTPTARGRWGPANVTTVAVTCSTNPLPTFTVGGTVSRSDRRRAGAPGQRRRTTCPIGADGAFTFATPSHQRQTATPSRSLVQPSGQTCTVSNGSGRHRRRQRDDRRGDLRRQLRRPASPSAGR